MPDHNEELSDRELEILRLVATGASNKEIATRLFISANTVKVHLRNIFTKIGVNSRTEAAMYAVNANLVPGSSSKIGTEFIPAIEQDVLAAQQNEVLEKEQGKSSLWYKSRWWLIALISLLVLSMTVILFQELLLQSSANRFAATASAVPLAADSVRWQVLTPLPTARFGLAVATYEGYIYVIAGSSSQGAVNIVERYDLVSNSWGRVSPKPTAVYEVSAALIGGKIHVPGGRLTVDRVTDVLEIYNPSEDTWSKGSPMPIKASSYGLVAFEGRLFLFGGWDGKGYLDTVYEYDPAQDMWSMKTAMNLERGYAGTAVAGGKIYVLGGFDGEHSLKSNDVYQPAKDDGYNNPWIRAHPLPSGRYGMGVTSIAEIIQLVGGVEDGNATPPSLAYFPHTDQWGVFERLGSQSWSQLGAITLGTNLYIIGGLLEKAPTNLNLSYQAIYTLAIPVVP